MYTVRASNMVSGHLCPGGAVPKAPSAPQVRRKIVVVSGDLCQPGLGLAAADRRRLCREVNYVVHCAASISFVEPVLSLLAQNYVVGTLRGLPGQDSGSGLHVAVSAIHFALLILCQRAAACFKAASHEGCLACSCELQAASTALQE